MRNKVRVTALPKFISPASIEAGDIISVSWSAGGVEHTRRARVHRRVDDGELRVFYTEEGYEILHWIPGSPLISRVTLHARAVPAHGQVLLDLFAEMEALKA